jgi:hypothetical protein
MLTERLIVGHEAKIGIYLDHLTKKGHALLNNG